MENSNSINGKNENTQNAYFLSLEVENIRCFGERQVIDFSDGNGKHKKWTIILGNNGTGKTTLLQSLIAMLPQADIVGGLVDPLVNKLHFSTDWFSHLDKLTPSKLKAKFTKPNPNLPNPEMEYLGNESLGWQWFQLNCFGYGASRKGGETSLSESETEKKYASLFDEKKLLINPEEWLLQADYSARRESSFKEHRDRQLEIVKEILVKVLPDVDEIRFGEKDRGKTLPAPTVEFHTHYGWVEAKDLSLGYRTSMAWIVDFASRLFDIDPNSENPLAAPAVVLIDEIDLHLHPKWQRDLLPWLSDVFPNTQFIVTTHSPLIVQSAVARDANIVLCQRMGDQVKIEQITENLNNMRVDQILTGDYFGLETARPKDIEDELLERQEILSKAKITKRDEKRLKTLEEEIGSLPVGEDIEDDKAMAIIKRAAERLQSQS